MENGEESRGRGDAGWVFERKVKAVLVYLGHFGGFVSAAVAISWRLLSDEQTNPLEKRRNCWKLLRRWCKRRRRRRR
jgi:hypothetical protein